MSIIRPAWELVADHASTLSSDQIAQRRLRHLAVFALAAAKKGLLSPPPSAVARGQWLFDQVLELSNDRLDLDCGTRSRLNELYDCALPLSLAVGNPAQYDQYVGLWQGEEEDRKNKGAYATPRALADEVARKLSGDSSKRVLDPSCGTGALLLAVLREQFRRDPNPQAIRRQASNLHGIDIDPVAVEIAQLSLWLASHNARVPLEVFRTNIRASNALTRTIPGWDSFDALVMNPPWESLRQDPIGSTSSASAIRAEILARLRQSRQYADDLPPLYSAQGVGDVNVAKLFIELAPHLTVNGGQIVAILPGAWSSDLGMRPLRELYLNSTAISSWTGFENRERIFPSIDGRYKFGVLSCVRDPRGTTELSTRSFASKPVHVRARHVKVDRPSLLEIGGSHLAIPELGTRAERDTLTRIRSKGEPFFSDEHVSKYRREADLTLDRTKGRLIHREEAEDLALYVPVLEGRMVGQYDFFQKSWLSGSGRTATWVLNGETTLDECRSQFVAEPGAHDGHRLAICDVTSATNARTVHATWVPPTWVCGNTAPVLQFEDRTSCFAHLAVLNSLTFDWQARYAVAGLHLNKFYLENLRFPRLGQTEIRHLAAHACNILLSNKRVWGLDSKSVATIAEMAASTSHEISLITIERMVADGFGLSKTMLKTVLDPRQSNRRGFWRYFQTHAGERVARALLQG